MPFVRRLAVLTCLPVLFAGCGGATKHPSSEPTTTVSNPATAALPSTTTSTTSTAATATNTAASSHHSAGASGTPGIPASGGAGLPAGSSHGRGGGPRQPAGGKVSAVIPANFTLSASGALSPRTVSAPAFVAVAIDIHSLTGTPQSITVQTPAPITLRVPPHGRALTTLPGMRAGTYPILVGGVRRGAIIAGAEPGP